MDISKGARYILNYLMYLIYKRLIKLNIRYRQKIDVKRSVKKYEFQK